MHQDTMTIEYVNDKRRKMNSTNNLYNFKLTNKFDIQDGT